MRLVIGSDHGGYEAKEKAKRFLQGLGHEVSDFGCHGPEAVDYPDVAQLVGVSVAPGQHERGFLFDGFGGAVALAANKVRGVRAVCAYDSVSARLAMAHDDANILCVGGKTRGELAIQEILTVFLSTRFEGGRHERRLAKVAAIEEGRRP